MNSQRKEEIEKLIKKSGDSLKSAEILYEQQLYDSSLSRAYYSMFYLAEAVLLTKDLVFSKHSGVISAFGKHFVASGELATKLHRLLIEASKNRTTGDYDFMVDINKEDTKEIIKMAREFQEGVMVYLKDYLDRKS